VFRLLLFGTLVATGTTTRASITNTAPDSTNSTNLPKTAQILAEIYLALNGRRGSWSNKDGWQLLDDLLDQHSGNTSLDTGDWSGVVYCNNQFHGILCNDQGQVQAILLASNGLSGTIPSQIFQLPGLEVLDMAYNRVQMEHALGFSGLGAATNLMRLRLSNTDVATLHGIGEGLSLQELFLDGCDFDDDSNSQIPTELFRLTRLTTLHLESSSLAGTIPSEIRQLASSLTKLSLHENQLNGAIPSELAELTKLQYLDLSDNDWQGTIPAEFSNNGSLRTLVSLRINRARGGLGGTLPSFRGLEHIQELELGYNSFSGAISENFLSGRTVQDNLVVKLMSNKLEGTIPLSLGSYSRVRLELQNNMITGIPSDLCSKSDWMDGEVATNGCDAILCPASTWNPKGRSSGTEPCEPCTGNVYYGDTTCATKGLQSNREVEILDSLFIATGGQNWNASHTNWTTPGVPICYREGVVCGWPTDDMNWGVTELHLSGFGLRGQIPTAIFDLPRIRVLSLSVNEINVSFDGIDHATILEVLNLGKTKQGTFCMSCMSKKIR
jgi:hypothetical protein